MATIKFERFERECGHNQNIRKAGETSGILYDWRVLIDGEYRARLTRQSSNYDIRDPDGQPIKSTRDAANTWMGKHRGSEVDKRANFEQFVTDLLHEGRIPTLQQLAGKRAQDAADKLAREKQARQNVLDWHAKHHGPALLAALDALVACRDENHINHGRHVGLEDVRWQEARDAIAAATPDENDEVFKSSVEQEIWQLERAAS